MEQDNVNEAAQRVARVLDYILNQTRVDLNNRTPEGVAALLRALVEFDPGVFRADSQG